MQYTNKVEKTENSQNSFYMTFRVLSHMMSYSNAYYDSRLEQLAK